MEYNYKNNSYRNIITPIKTYHLNQFWKVMCLKNYNLISKLDEIECLINFFDCVGMWVSLMREKKKKKSWDNIALWTEQCTLPIFTFIMNFFVTLFNIDISSCLLQHYIVVRLNYVTSWEWGVEGLNVLSMCCSVGVPNIQSFNWEDPPLGDKQYLNREDL